MHASTVARGAGQLRGVVESEAVASHGQAAVPAAWYLPAAGKPDPAPVNAMRLSLCPISAGPGSASLAGPVLASRVNHVTPRRLMPKGQQENTMRIADQCGHNLAPGGMILQQVMNHQLNNARPAEYGYRRRCC